MGEIDFEYYYRKSNFLVCDIYVVSGYTFDNKKWEITYFGILGQLHEIKRIEP